MQRKSDLANVALTIYLDKSYAAERVVNIIYYQNNTRIYQKIKENINICKLQNPCILAKESFLIVWSNTILVLLSDKVKSKFLHLVTKPFFLL